MAVDATLTPTTGQVVSLLSQWRSVRLAAAGNLGVLTLVLPDVYLNTTLLIETDFGVSNFYVQSGSATAIQGVPQSLPASSSYTFQFTSSNMTWVITEGWPDLTTVNVASGVYSIGATPVNIQVQSNGSLLPNDYGVIIRNGALLGIPNANGASAVTSVAGKVGAVTLAVADVAGAAPLASPTFTGNPVVPNYATTAALATEITRATAAEALKAPLASPTFTGTPLAPTATTGTNTTQLATTAFVTAACAAVGAIVSGTPVTTIASSGSSQTLTYPAKGSICYDITLNANCTFTVSGGNAGQYQTIILILRQSGGGGFTPTLPGSIRWPNSVTPSPNTVAGKIDRYLISTPDSGTTLFGGY